METTSLFVALMATGRAYHAASDTLVTRHNWSNPFARGDFYRVYWDSSTNHPTGDVLDTLGEVEQVVHNDNGWTIVEKTKVKV